MRLEITHTNANVPLKMVIVYWVIWPSKHYALRCHSLRRFEFKSAWLGNIVVQFNHVTHFSVKVQGECKLPSFLHVTYIETSCLETLPTISIKCQLAYRAWIRDGSGNARNDMSVWIPILKIERSERVSARNQLPITLLINCGISITYQTSYSHYNSNVQRSHVYVVTI